MLCITKTRVFEWYAQLLQFSLDEVDQASVEQLLMLRVDFAKILLVQKANQPHTKFRNIVVFIDKQAYCLLFREGELQPQSELLIGATFRIRFLNASLSFGEIYNFYRFVIIPSFNFLELLMLFLLLLCA